VNRRRRSPPRRPISSNARIGPLIRAGPSAFFGCRCWALRHRTLHLSDQRGSEHWVAAHLVTGLVSEGATDFLTKPLDTVEVLLRIHNLLETRALHLRIQAEDELLEQRGWERTAELRGCEGAGTGPLP
jgi:hypothetical protein